MLEDLVMTRTEAEKLYDVFRRKYREKIESIRPNMVEYQGWRDYLASIEGVEYICKFSDYSDPLDHLLEAINHRQGERFVIRCPLSASLQGKNYFILIEKTLAQKILVFGSLP